MKKGFTLVELLVVIAILGALAAALITAFGNAPEKAEVATCQDLVRQTATALKLVNEKNDGLWPQCLIANSNKSQGLDAKAAYPLATKGGMSLTSNSGTQSLSGLDKFGVITPWAARVVKERGQSCTETTAIPSGGTIADHRFRYAIDVEGLGKIEGVDVPGTIASAKNAKTVDVRDTAVVWCRGPKGQVIVSWGDGQTNLVK